MKVNGVTLACTSLVGITSLSFAILSSSVALADTSVTSTATVTIAESCTMSGITNTAHTANLVNGTYSGTDYTNGIGQTTLKVFCNDSAGFAIYAIGYTNNEYGNTYLHWNKASSDSDHTADIQTGIYTSGSTTNSTWSMKLAALTGTYAASIDDGNSSHNNSTEDYTNWHEVPTAYERVAYRLSGTDLDQSGVGIGSSITTTYDAYISGMQPAGTYIGQVKYTLVHPNTAAEPEIPMDPLDPELCPAYSICYAPNSTTIEGDMSSLGAITDSPTAGRQTDTLIDQNGTTSDIDGNTTSVALITPNFYRSGYGFAGWSTSFDVTTADNPIIYGPNESISTDSANGGIDLSRNGLILYPVWIASKGDLQGWAGCSGLTPASYNSTDDTLSASLDSITALTDTRDNNTYTVARLADGLCWMVENLRISSEHTTSAADIAKAQGYGDDTANNRGKFIGLADSEDEDFNTTAPTAANNSTNSLYSSDGSTSMNIGTSQQPANRIPRYNNNNTNMAANATNSDGVTTLDNSYNANNNHVRWYGYGNYYNWPAAMASTTHYSTYSGVSGSDAAGTSLCPSGWHLPLGVASTGALVDGANDATNRVSSFSYLDRKMGGTGQNYASTVGAAQSNKWRKFPNNFVYAGNIDGSSNKGRGFLGYYWTSSVMSGSYPYRLYLTITHVNPGTDIGGKYLGYSVRCVADF